MSKLNYSTTRNKPGITTIIINKSVICDLSSKQIKELRLRKKYLNNWEKVFYNSIKEKGYKIVSDKQGAIINNIIKKYDPRRTTMVSSKVSR